MTTTACLDHRWTSYKRGEFSWNFTAYQCKLMVRSYIMPRLYISVLGNRLWVFYWTMDGKTALVFGSCGGVGTSVVTELLKRGCKVCVHCVSLYGGIFFLTVQYIVLRRLWQQMCFFPKRVLKLCATLCNRALETILRFCTNSATSRRKKQWKVNRILELSNCKSECPF